MIEQLLVVITRLLVEDVDLPLLSLICVSDDCHVLLNPFMAMDTLMLR